MSDKKIWFGSQPERCDICDNLIVKRFVDGKTVMGPWAMMCTRCHKTHGRGLGVGWGQMYELQGDQYVKIEG